MPDKDALDADSIRQQLEELIDYLSRPSYGKVEFWEMLAHMLSRAIHREQLWTWRYIQGIHEGHLPPSKDFAHAVEILLAIVDGAHPLAAQTEQLLVFVFPASVAAGSIVMGRSVSCPVCGIWFVPNVPWRKKCPACSPPK